jgi:hypothetical protein
MNIPTNIDRELITNVFRTICKNDGPVKNSMKKRNPTHSLPKKPVAGLKSWNAITIPNIGR